MKSQTSKTPIYVLAGLVTVAVLGFSFVFLLKPQLDDISSTKDQTKASESTSAQLRITNSALRQQAETIPATRKEVATFVAQFPNEAAQRNLLNDLVALAGRSGVKVTDIAAQDPAQGAAPAPGAPPIDPVAAAAAAAASGTGALPIGSAILNIEASGSGEGLRSFIASLERSNRSISSQNVDISFGSASGPGALKLTFVTYISKPVVEPDLAVLKTVPVGG